MENSTKCQQCYFYPKIEEINEAVASIDENCIENLQTILCQVYRKFQVSEEEEKILKEQFYEVSNLLKQKMTNVNVYVYGSYATGFANRKSDLDTTLLSFSGKRLNQLSKRSQRKKLKQALIIFQAWKGISIIVNVLDATVPILKFKMKNNIDADLSASSIDGIYNTALFRRYSESDPRVLILIQLLKQVTELYNISSRKDGTLSSLSYYIMVIHFLQQKHILKILPRSSLDQGLSKFDEDQNWFYRDEEKINKIWKSNSVPDSISSLWIEFFKYFTNRSTFDMENQVVTINQLPPLAKSTKNWRSFLSIENPIQTNIDLGKDLTKPNFTLIKDAFSEILFLKGDIEKIKIQSRNIKTENSLNGRQLVSLGEIELNVLKEVLHQKYESKIVDECKIDEFRTLFYGISNQIKQKYRHLDACLFGSHVTGLGNRNSKLEINILFHDNDHKILQNINEKSKKKRMNKVNSYLQIYTNNNSVLKIFAKELHEVFLMILLRRYSDFDSRLCILMILVEEFAVNNQIGCENDNSEMLSSLAYSIMLIHFLQKKHNLKVLSEIESANLISRKNFKCDMWYKPTEKVVNAWNCAASGKSIAELWIGFFEYYTKEFDAKNLVVSIRHDHTVSKSPIQKSHDLVIEDPIKPSINLAANIGKVKLEKIMKKFFLVIENGGLV